MYENIRVPPPRALARLAYEYIRNTLLKKRLLIKKCKADLKINWHERSIGEPLPRVFKSYTCRSIRTWLSDISETICLIELKLDERQHGDPELLKWYHSNIQDVHHVSHLKILQTTSLKPNVLLNQKYYRQHGESELLKSFHCNVKPSNNIPGPCVR